jgi:hypothetical protein
MYRLMIARFPYMRIEDPDVTDWLVTTVIAAREDKRILSPIVRYRRVDTPIPMCRNQAACAAIEQEVDFLLMVDSDMSPDAYLPGNPYALGQSTTAKPFWHSSFDFAVQMRKQGTPCMIAAPYCGPPPHENVYVFRWTTLQGDHPNIDHALSQFTREDAAERRGIERVAALPTGIILVDVQSLKKLKSPYFYYEWTDSRETDKASTEDVTFTRDPGLLDVPIFCNWDAWAGHWKDKCVGKPTVLTSSMIGQKYREAVARDLREPPMTERIMRIDEGQAAAMKGLRYDKNKEESDDS